MSPVRPRLAVRVARRVVWLASLLVRGPRRERFVEEWHGELSSDPESGGWRVVVESFGAVADARALRDLELRERGGSALREWVGGWWRDLSVALRGMRRTPTFTAVAVATLAIGIGGTSAMYTLVERVVLDPLPYPQPERLVRLDNQVPGVGPDEVWKLSTAQFVYFSDHATTLDAVGVYWSDAGNVATAAGPQHVVTVAVTASVMGLLGARAEVGRIITAADDTPGSAEVALLSHESWERLFGRDASVIGRTLDIGGGRVEVVGVAAEGLVPPGWLPGEVPDLWTPMRIDRSGDFFSHHVFAGIARMAPGETPGTVQAELEGFTPRLPDAFPRAYSQRFFDQYGFRTHVTPLKESVLGELAAKLWVVFGGVGLLLLTACANVANLFIVRMEGRRREIAVRAALGGGRLALARYVASEGLALSALGAVASLVAVRWAIPLLTGLAPAELARLSGIGADWGTVLFASVVAVGVGLVMSAHPIVVHARRGLSGEIPGRGGTAGPGKRRLRSALVMAQVAVALTLGVGSGLLVRTLTELRHKELGFEPEGVLTLELSPDPSVYDDAPSVRGLQGALLDRVGALPGVAVVGLGEELPVSGGFGCTVQGFEDRDVYARVEAAGQTTCAGEERVTPGFFEALGMTVLEGRGLERSDLDESAASAVVVSRAFAERFWPGQDAIGKGVYSGNQGGPPFARVVGVVGDVPAASAEGQPPLSQTAVAIYYPHVGAWTLVVKADVDEPSSLFPAIRRAIAEVDPGVAIAAQGDMRSVVGRATAQLSFVSLLLEIAAAAALLLAAVGLYGVISYDVTHRTREIGMRMAVGARPLEVQRLVVGKSAVVVLGGLVVGVLLALASTRVMRGLLVGVANTEPSVYVASGALLLAVGLLASWLPARRASRIDPVRALRGE